MLLVLPGALEVATPPSDADTGSASSWNMLLVFAALPG